MPVDARRHGAMRATSWAVRPNLQYRDKISPPLETKWSDNGAGMTNQHTSLLQGNTASRLKRRSDTLPRAHIENRWKLYKASWERQQQRRTLRTPKSRKGRGTTPSRRHATKQERRETWRQSISDYRRVLGASHRRPSPETTRRPHTTTAAGRKPEQARFKKELQSTT